MSLFSSAIGFIIHIDVHLAALIAAYPHWIYALLFAIIFAETGLVVMPFLPGDSLLFAAGSFAALGSLNLFLLWFLLVVAAILGDSANYMMGSFFGPRAFKSESHLIFNRNHLERTKAFYHKHGGSTLIFARFMPIVRTFAPFVAGMAHMHYMKFLLYNVLGALLWVSIFTFGGYFFGNLPIVRDNFSLVILFVILLSVVPLLIPRLRRMMGRFLGPPHLR